MATDAAKDVVIGGDYSGAVDFGGGALPSTGTKDVFLAMYDAGGKWLWFNHFGGPSGSGGVSSVALDPSGKVLAAGPFTGTIDFGGSAPLVSQGTSDTFVLALDPSSGATISAERFGASGVAVNANKIATDALGNVLLSGGLSGTMDFGCGPVYAITVDSFLVQMNDSGACLWSEHFGAGDLSNVLASGLAVDGSNHVVVGGTFQGSVDFGGPSPILSGGANDVFVAKLASGGAPLWAYGFGDPNNGQSVAELFDLTTDTSSNVLVTGEFSGSMDFGSVPPLVSMGGFDIFVAKLGPLTPDAR